MVYYANVTWMLLRKNDVLSFYIYFIHQQFAFICFYSLLCAKKNGGVRKIHEYSYYTSIVILIFFNRHFCSSIYLFTISSSNRD